MRAPKLIVEKTGPLAAASSLSLQVAFRRCMARDLPLLESGCGWANDPHILREIFSRQRADRAVILLALIGNLPVGQVWIDWDQSTGENAVLWALRVLREFQGVGIGTRLMELAEDLVRRRGIRSLGLSVACNNRRALRLYRRLGYQPVRRTGLGQSLRTGFLRASATRRESLLSKDLVSPSAIGSH